MRAILSVWDKTGIATLARRLAELGWEIISTGGTQRALEEAGVPAIPVSDVTRFPELLQGRVKTLHPAIHAGILARRDQPEQVAALAEHRISPIDLVVVNLYPFGEVVRSEAPLDEALEHIDIGGPALLRAAAKNFPFVLPLVDPLDYEPVLQRLAQGGPAAVPLSERRRLAAKAFAHVATYDAVIADYLRDPRELPDQLPLALVKARELRYGENPHQQAALYHLARPTAPAGVQRWRQLGGPEMSSNNYLDAVAAWQVVSALPQPAAVIVKHANPCGAAHAPELRHAYELALASDPISAFGGIVALNAPVDAGTASALAERVYDIVIAPAFLPEAVHALARRRNLRIVEAPEPPEPGAWSIRSLDGAALVQQADYEPAERGEWRVVTRRRPTLEEWDSLRFAWQVVRFVTSNAIVLAHGTASVGIGGGQPNRVDAVRLAVGRAGERARGSVLASDAFFPFPDSIQVAAEAGVTAIVQPGGSRRDDEVVQAADQAGIAMVFTGVRHFRH
ncbi:bifunctional phosphoribosylaminoimidazolecarboxamide formyltransferase/IMP cyclohydrolase [Thermomicrobiaceae bacterium CFH 74404]|uniref:Bifunctional purine biosynthesis protein PurH n=1 Tax=Thermalbibacter longus TaxID=2951981 RepID=A0AA42BDJ1_9BACT|nr:bifunctional phosphoribosylaminoimidazolecarboxamide formyltransferase/IMP cyclohydrolase [Thermalbibacter longus]MCM8749808.1 bifunctional phosphoribosylaminoimidazolecarboxamide formyltransferase/IMP cyclohydrolase [Thermalbibacter longus]